MNKPRLIDANKLMENLKAYSQIDGTVLSKADKRLIECICGHIEYLEPTAYDIDKIKEMEDYIKELEAITGLMQKRTYYRKFVDEVWKKQEGKELSEPDFDYIYKLYFELIEARDKVVEQLEEEKEFHEQIEYSLLALGYRSAYKKAIEIVKGGVK